MRRRAGYRNTEGKQGPCRGAGLSTEQGRVTSGGRGARVESSRKRPGDHLEHLSPETHSIVPELMLGPVRPMWLEGTQDRGGGEGSMQNDRVSPAEHNPLRTLPLP